MVYTNISKENAAPIFWVLVHRAKVLMGYIWVDKRPGQGAQADWATRYGCRRRAGAQPTPVQVVHMEQTFPHWQ
jgi:hypothetical protein